MANIFYSCLATKNAISNWLVNLPFLVIRFLAWSIVRTVYPCNFNNSLYNKSRTLTLNFIYWVIVILFFPYFGLLLSYLHYCHFNHPPSGHHAASGHPFLALLQDYLVPACTQRKHSPASLSGLAIACMPVLLCWCPWRGVCGIGWLFYSRAKPYSRVGFSPASLS